MRVVILQPSYIPWRGYFHQIALADIFVFYDDVKYDKNGWRNRNRIKTAQGSQWMTIPVLTANLERDQIPINQIKIDSSKSWAQKHWRALVTSYHKAPYFQDFAPIVQEALNSPPEQLAEFTIPLTIQLARALGIKKTHFIQSSSLEKISCNKTDRLISILNQLEATEYISGPAAKEYLEEDKFLANKIKLTYMTYHYPDYPQFYPPFDPNLSILDLLFMIGPHALEYILPQ
ncbi:MAG: WbqC family protein [Anaerolineaceae bacterium]|nr:WbqC family protein [Anaerolineaceae bacterium]